MTIYFRVLSAVVFLALFFFTMDLNNTMSKSHMWTTLDLAECLLLMAGLWGLGFLSGLDDRK